MVFKDVIINEWRAIVRNRMLVYAGVTFVISLVITTWISVEYVKHQQALHQQAREHIRSQWDNMGDSNPHSAVHFGTYAFKPYGLNSSFDEGVNAVTGNVLRLEGHVQNEMQFSEASLSLEVSPFGKISPALLLQYVIPLLLIFLSFSTISSERESGRLKLLAIQGLSTRKMIIAKSFAITCIGIVMLAAVLLIQLFLLKQTFSQDIIMRLLLFAISYIAYYYILILLTVIFSAFSPSPTAALSSVLAVWIIWTVFLPRIAGTFSEETIPLPSRKEFLAAMKEDRDKGIDGHAPSGERRQVFIQKVLNDYNADSIQQLSFNIDGLLMQADEDFGNIVWDKHFGKNYEILKSQKQLYQKFGFLDPYLAIQNLSMGLSGSDLFHHQEFVIESENYRREFIKTLNDKHAYGGSKAGDWSWKADQEFYRSVAGFDYNPPHINGILHYYVVDLAVLLLWLSLLVSIVVFTGNKISIA